MKKILSFAFILLGINTFSNMQTTNQCSFINNPDTFLGNIIKKVEKEKKVDEIFCDSESLKMLYYVVDDGNYNLNLGVSIKVSSTTTNDHFREIFKNKLVEYKAFLSNYKLTNLKNGKLPDKEIIRFFGVLNDKEKFFIIGKYEIDNKTKKEKFYAHPSGKDAFTKINLFKDMEVEYMNDTIY